MPVFPAICRSFSSRRLTCYRYRTYRTAMAVDLQQRQVFHPVSRRRSISDHSLVTVESSPPASSRALPIVRSGRRGRTVRGPFGDQVIAYSRDAHAAQAAGCRRRRSRPVRRCAAASGCMFRTGCEVPWRRRAIAGIRRPPPSRPPPGARLEARPAIRQAVRPAFRWAVRTAVRWATSSKS